MNHLDLLEKAYDIVSQGQKILWITLAQTWGGSPRPIGSILLVTEKKAWHGSVTGGCLEEELRNLPFSDIPQVLTYGINSEQAQRYGLPCGGKITLIAETITHTNILQPALQALQKRENITRILDLKTGNITYNNNKTEITLTEQSFTHSLGPNWRLLLIGVGHLAYEITQLAIKLNFQVIICDPRIEEIANWHIEQATIETIMPDDAVHKWINDDRGIILTLSHNPKLDDLALTTALTSPAFYIGALGSQKTNQARKERLLSLGLTAKQIQRLHGPMGLDIRSKTPVEIAIAVLGEIIYLRNKL